MATHTEGQDSSSPPGCSHLASPPQAISYEERDQSDTMFNPQQGVVEAMQQQQQQTPPGRLQVGEMGGRMIRTTDAGGSMGSFIGIR